MIYQLLLRLEITSLILYSSFYLRCLFCLNVDVMNCDFNITDKLYELILFNNLYCILLLNNCAIFWLNTLIKFSDNKKSNLIVTSKVLVPLFRRQWSSTYCAINIFVHTKYTEGKKVIYSIYFTKYDKVTFNYMKKYKHEFKLKKDLFFL